MPSSRLLLLGLLGLVGCASPSPHELWITERPLHAGAAVERPTVRDLDRPAVPTKFYPQRSPMIDGPVDLRRAVSMSLAYNPRFAAAGYEVAALGADADQAGRARNPVVGLSVENFAGPEGGDLFQRQTLRLSQVIELRGKREKREALASAEQRLSAWDFEQMRLEVATLAVTRYIAVLTDQQRVALAEQNLALAQRALAIVEDRVDGGLVPGAELDKARVRVALQRIEMQRAERSLSASRSALAATWGGTSGEGIEVAGDLSHRVTLPDEAVLRERLSQSPAILRVEAVAEQRRAALALARARATPDPTIGGGVRFFPDSNDAAGVAEVSWPLPIRDRNGSGILAARLRLAQVQELERAAWAEASSQLAETYATLSASAFELDTLDGEAIPAAERAYNAASERFDQGQSDYLDVLDAERTLVEVKVQRLEAARSYHTAVAEIERLTAEALVAEAE